MPQKRPSDGVQPLISERIDMKKRHIEIMDTTLRDGEQTSGVSFTVPEKLTLARLLLEELKVDRIEVASARVSEGEFESVRQIAAWASEAGFLPQVEVLSFVDRGDSLQWILKAGARTQNLLTKGSLNHLTHQLRKTPEAHFRDVGEVLRMAREAGVRSNVYLEDWSNGMRHSKSYVLEFLDFLQEQPVERILLPDTLGVLTPMETGQFLAEILERYPRGHFDFHGHNDYDLSVANVLEAVRAGVHGLHLTVNGMGERAGNAPLASVVAVINDFLPEAAIGVEESALYKVSKLVSAFREGKHPEKPAGTGPFPERFRIETGHRAHYRTGRQKGKSHAGGPSLHHFRCARQRGLSAEGRHQFLCAHPCQGTAAHHHGLP